MNTLHGTLLRSGQLSLPTTNTIRTLERPRETWAQRREFDCNAKSKNVSVEHVQGNRHETRRNMLARQDGCI